MEKQQTYANHVRWYPLFHFTVVPLLLLNLIWQAVLLYQAPGWSQAEAVVFGLTIILLALAARLMALRAQDRVIRLEERLRHQRLLESDLAAKGENLPVGEIIALRFASDEELPGIVSQVVVGTLKTPKEIKMAVKNWRGDYLRV